jgi:UDP-glucose 4-epimerase
VRILITGGAGFIGSHVAEAYRAAGHHVAVADVLTGENRTPEGCAFYLADIRTPELEKVFQDERPEVVSHHAAQANVRRSLADPVSDAETNVLGTLRVLDLAVRHGARQVIFSSTAGALYGEPDEVPVREDHPVLPTSPYGLHKSLGEHYMRYFRRLHGLNTTVLRYGNVYGPRQDPSTEAGVVAIFTDALLLGRRPVIFGDGSQVRDFVYVGDVAEANLRAVGRDLPQPIHIGAGVGTSVTALAERLRALVGSDLVPDHGPAVPGEVHRIFLDVTRARKTLGWEARVPLEEGLRRTVEWFRARRPRTPPPPGRRPNGARSGSERTTEMIEKELLEILACPACKAPVVQKDDRIVCTGCGRRYPIREGIPVMLVDEAQPRPS